MIYDIYFWCKGWYKSHGAFAEAYVKDHKWFVYPPTPSRKSWVITTWHEDYFKCLTFREVRKHLKERNVL